MNNKSLAFEDYTFSSRGRKIQSYTITWQEGGVEGRDSSPARTSKSQLAAEQPSTGECWIQPKKDTPCPKAKENPHQDGRRGKITFRIKPYTHQRCSEGSNKTM